MSALGGKADVVQVTALCPLLTHKRHRGRVGAFPTSDGRDLYKKPNLISSLTSGRSLDSPWRESVAKMAQQKCLHPL